MFAKAFLTALQENRDVLDGQQLFNLVRRPVVLNASQTPEYTDIRYAGHEGVTSCSCVRRQRVRRDSLCELPPPLPGDTPAPASPAEKSMENAQQKI